MPPSPTLSRTSGKTTIGLVLAACFLAVVVAMNGSPASAAGVRFASPTAKGTGDCSSAANACTLQVAMSGSQNGDEVIVAGNEGTYGTETLPITTAIAAPSGVRLNVHGAVGQPRPVIYVNDPTTGNDFSIEGTISGLDLEVGGVLYASDTVIDHMWVRSSSGPACYGGGNTIVNSVCTGAVGLGLTCTGCQTTLTIRNSTIIGTSDGSSGIGFESNGATTITANITNSIVNGGVSDIRTETTNGGAVQVNLDHSNYATVDSAAGGSVTAAGTGSNQIAAPMFIDAPADNYRQAPGSPTIDAGVTSQDNGTTDLDGNPRTQGAATDIGAYEFASSPPTTPPSTPAVAVECSDHAATIVGTGGDDTIVGTDGADVIAGLGGDDEIRGMDGKDLICGGPGEDDIRGDSGKDRMFGGHGRDQLRGNSGRDRLSGGSGKDEIRGGSGSDRLFGGSGRDKLYGGDGDHDLCRGDSGNDKSSGGCEERNSANSH